jgi:predicted RND superfamily exporter protein
MMSLAMFAVIVLSLALGVGMGYAIIFGILYAFDRSRQSEQRVPAHARVFNTSAGSD